MIIVYFRKRYLPSGAEEWLSGNKFLLPVIMWPEMHPDGHWHCTDQNTGEEWLITWPEHDLLIKSGIKKEYPKVDSVR